MKTFIWVITTMFVGGMFAVTVHARTVTTCADLDGDGVAETCITVEVPDNPPPVEIPPMEEGKVESNITVTGDPVPLPPSCPNCKPKPICCDPKPPTPSPPPPPLPPQGKLSNIMVAGCTSVDLNGDGDTDDFGETICTDGAHFPSVEPTETQVAHKGVCYRCDEDGNCNWVPC